MSALTKPPVSELEIESTSLDLFQEFLSNYFDGGSHAIGQNAAIVFPKAALRFQQTALPQPLDGNSEAQGLAITAIWMSPGRVNRCFEAASNSKRQERATTRSTWLFWIRAQAQNSGGGNSSRLCQQAAEKLFALLQNSAETKPLAGKGIHHLRPSPPQIIQDSDYAVRMVSCAGQLRYIIKSQP